MKHHIFYVVESNGGYYISNRKTKEHIVFSGTWQSCRHFIDPSY